LTLPMLDLLAILTRLLIVWLTRNNRVILHHLSQTRLGPRHSCQSDV
jgi:hypothetical protein